MRIIVNIKYYYFTAIYELLNKYYFLINKFGMLVRLSYPKLLIWFFVTRFWRSVVENCYKRVLLNWFKRYVPNPIFVFNHLKSRFTFRFVSWLIFNISFKFICLYEYYVKLLLSTKITWNFPAENVHWNDRCFLHL